MLPGPRKMSRYLKQVHTQYMTPGPRRVAQMMGTIKQSQEQQQNSRPLGRPRHSQEARRPCASRMQTREMCQETSSKSVPRLTHAKGPVCSAEARGRRCLDPACGDGELPSTAAVIPQRPPVKLQQKELQAACTTDVDRTAIEKTPPERSRVW